MSKKRLVLCMQCMSKTSLMWCCLWLLTIVVVMMEHLVHCVRVCVCMICMCYWHTHTHTQPYSGILSGTTWMSRYQKKHTHSHPSWSSDTLLSTSSIYYDPWHPLCSVYMLDSPVPQPLSRSSLVSLLVLDPLLIYFILHTFLHTIIMFFVQHMPIPAQPFCCSTGVMSSIPYWVCVVCYLLEVERFTS